MLYNLLFPLAEHYPLFNLFKYLTFRSGAAVMTALLISFIFGPMIIRWLKSKQAHGQPIRDDGPESHLLTKQGTPTMGGVMILLAVSVSTILWANLANPYVWITLFVTTGYGMIGFVDDYIKLTKRHHAGLSGKMKLLLQFAVAIFAVLWIQKVASPDQASHLAFPFIKDFMWDMGWFYVLFAGTVMVGASNAVNLTDGLDGLAIVPIMIAAACFGLISYLIGNVVFADYLQVHHLHRLSQNLLLRMYKHHFLRN